MRLNRVLIRNYRSIGDMELDFSERVRILVGTNEGGKSNIIKALGLLAEDAKVQDKDVRYAVNDENPIEEAFVKFEFDCSDYFESFIADNIKSKLLTPNPLEGHVLATKSGERLTLLEFFNRVAKSRLKVDVKSGERSYLLLLLKSGTYKHVGEWRKVRDGYPNPVPVRDSSGREVDVRSFEFVHATFYPSLPTEILSIPSPEDWNNLIGSWCIQYAKDNPMRIARWEYLDEYQLPNSLQMASFVANPNICLPLKRMFTIAGISEPAKELKAAMGSSHQHLLNLLNRVAERTTNHLKTAWPEYWKEFGHIQLSLVPNGPALVISVKDSSNLFEFSQRSNGFKRFVSFLIMISSRVRAGTLRGALLILDEPEIGLHPLGAEHLRDELIRLGETNTVVFSTHSVHMIDTTHAPRHIVVKKRGELTEIIDEKSDIFEEEIIFRGLKTSVFSFLKKKNIVFEGWRDHKLFVDALAGSSARAKKLRKAFDGIGHGFAHGAKDISRVSTILQLGNRSCIFVSDSDPAARKYQEAFLSNRGHGTWLRYDEILQPSSIVTGEDFLTETRIAACLAHLAKTEDSFERIDVTGRLARGGTLAYLRAQLKTKGIPQDKITQLCLAAKDHFFSGSGSGDIETIYLDFLSELESRIRKL